jgi:hypothetical protein
VGPWWTKIQNSASASTTCLMWVPPASSACSRIDLFLFTGWG